MQEAIIWPLGSLSFYGPSDKGIMGDLKVAVSGPLLQIPLMVILAILYVSLKTNDMTPFSHIFASYTDIINAGMGEFFLAICLETFWYNVFVISLNLLVPIYPFDAVRIWAALLRKRGTSLTKTAKIISYVGMFLSGCLFIFGVVEILFYEIFRLGLFELTLGASGLLSAKYLDDKINAGLLNTDPVFGRACYESAENSFEMNTTSTNVEVISNGNKNAVPIESTEGIV